MSKHTVGSLLQSCTFDGGPGEKDPRCVVRLTTNCYISGGKAVFSKSVTRLKRRSQLTFDELNFDRDAEINFSAITNLMTVPDGLYYLDPDETDSDGNEYSSWWYVVTWKLVPLVEE